MDREWAGNETSWYRGASVFKLIVVATLLLAAVLLWRKWQRAGRSVYIDNYPYQQHLDRRLAARRPELSADQRAEVLACLLDYFQICRQAGQRMVAMPSQAVDDAWHEFILFTRWYDRFCKRAFGRFLHHTPAEAMHTPTTASDGLKRAWRLACAREGIDPKRPARLPRLFALDASLGIAGGFIYQLDCLAASGGAAGSSYCASHIGCSSGSGCSGSTGCSGDTGGSTGSGSSGDGGASGSDGGGSGCGGGCGGGGD